MIAKHPSAPVISRATAFQTKMPLLSLNLDSQVRSWTFERALLFLFLFARLHFTPSPAISNLFFLSSLPPSVLLFILPHSTEFSHRLGSDRIEYSTCVIMCFWIG